MKMEPIEGSETSAIINQTPGNYPKGNLLYSVHGRSLKSSVWYVWKVRCMDTPTRTGKAQCILDHGKGPTKRKEKVSTMHLHFCKHPKYFTVSTGKNPMWE